MQQPIHGLNGSDIMREKGDLEMFCSLTLLRASQPLQVGVLPQPPIVHQDSATEL